MTLFVKSSKIKQKLYDKNLKKRTKQTKEEYKQTTPELTDKRNNATKTCDIIKKRTLNF